MTPAAARRAVGAFAAIVLCSLVATPPARAGSYQVLYEFPPGGHCCLPESLIRAPSGALFGVQGTDAFQPVEAPQGSGTGIFELDPPAGGQTAWTYSLIFSYDPDHPLPGQPPGYLNPELVIDPAGNIYFGTGTGFSVARTAAVVKLSRPAPGQTAWTQTILYDHHSPSYPNIASFHLTYLDSSGTLFGYDDKSDVPGVGGGTVFQVRPPSAGQAQATVVVLTRFGGPGNEYEHAPRSLLKVADGSFYGLADDGMGTGGEIPVIGYHLAPPALGETGWTRTTIFSFPNGYTDRLGPLIADRSLNLTGAAVQGGTNNTGYVYRLSPPAPGQSTWRASALYTFPSDLLGNQPPGFFPIGALVDWRGILLGTASNGGSGSDIGGTLFGLSAISPGSAALPWTQTLLHTFGGPPDGANPFGPVIPVTRPDGSLALFGMTLIGGHVNANNGHGIVYELIP